MKSQENIIYPLPEGYSMEQYDPDILNVLKTCLEHALTKSSRVLLVRLDFRYPKNLQDIFWDNYAMLLFTDKYTRFQGDKLLGYVWVREQCDAVHCHWHAVFFFDKNKMRYFASPREETFIWNISIEQAFPYLHLRHQLPKWGLVEVAPMIKNGMLIRRNDSAMIDEALRIISYLAKKFSKINMPDYGEIWRANFL